MLWVKQRARGSFIANWRPQGESQFCGRWELDWEVRIGEERKFLDLRLLIFTYVILIPRK